MKKKIFIGGIFKHRKGKLYQVKSRVIHSETHERMLVYGCLYPNELG